MNSDNIKKKHHFVPVHYLKNWLNSEGELFVYNLLVPNESVPIWKKSVPSKMGYRNHLYTVIKDDKESDEIETWLETDFETPAAPIIQKVIKNQRMSPKDWQILIRYAASQCSRTPAQYVKFSEWAERELKGIVTETVKAVLEDFENGELNSDLPIKSKTQNNFNPKFNVSINTDETEKSRIKVETVIGRDLWINQIRKVLTSTYEVLLRQKWTILKPPTGIKWVTSDNPAVRLSYESEQNYNFDGGWGVKNCEVLLPLSPDHLLYTRIGRKPSQRNHIIDLNIANKINRILIENAHLQIISQSELEGIETIRRRTVDLELYNHHQLNWKKWHVDQTDAESELFE